MVLKAIALLGKNEVNKEATSAYQKIVGKAHTVIISNRLIKQYQTKMEEDSIPVEFFLNFLQNVFEANHQLKKIGDNRASEMKLHVKFPSEDLFLAQIAMAADPTKFEVYIISKEHEILNADTQLQKKHGIRALSPSAYTHDYC
jgi:hypothetical protein